MTLSRFLRIVRARLHSLVGGRALDAALDDEVSFHLERLIEEKRAAGLGAREARLAALREFGNVTLVTEASRDARRLGWLHDLAQDARYGVRALRRSPGFCIVAIASLALGLGSSTAVIGAIRSVLWQPLPFAHPDRLVVIRTLSPETPAREQGVSLEEFLAWKERSRTLDAIGMALSSPREIGAEPGGIFGERLPSQAFTPGLFELLGVQPARGRSFEDAPTPFSARARVMLISHRLWQRRYGGASDIIGRAVPTDGATRTIIGVLPAGFRLQDDDVDFWIPLIPHQAEGSVPAIGRPFNVIARLRHGVTPADAQAELSAITADLVRGLPDRFAGRSVRIVPLQEAMYGWTQPLLFTLFGAVTVMLGIACANVAGLLLARATTRRRELWIRLSLGAGRGRIVRQLIGESLILAAGSAILGVPIVIAGLNVLVSSMGPPPGAARVRDIPFDMTLAAILIALSLVAALALGAIPALMAVRRGGSLAGTASVPPAAADLRSTATRGVLVAGQMAMALVLLVVAGLFLNSLVHLLRRELNFDPEGLASFQVVVEPREFVTRKGFDGLLPTFELTPLAAETIARIHDRLRAVPGIESVGGMTHQPVNSLVIPRFAVWPAPAHAEPRRQPSSRTVAGFLVTPDFFATMRTPVLRGREVSDGDGRTAPPVVVINQVAERLLFPGRSALGERLVVDLYAGAPAREVIGVVADVPTRRRLDPEPIVYLPSRQTPAVFRGGGANFFGLMTFVVRHTGDEAAVIEAARRAVHEVDPARPVVDVGVVRRWLDGRLAELSSYVGALAGFGVVALILASMGVYGVTSFGVATRTREVGIRRALGADTRAIVAALGWRSVKLLLAGLLCGLVIAFVITRFIASQLVDVSAKDPMTFALAAAVLTAVGLVACLIPTRRALAVDPAAVLKND